MAHIYTPIFFFFLGDWAPLSEDLYKEPYKQHLKIAVVVGKRQNYFNHIGLKQTNGKTLVSI